MFEKNSIPIIVITPIILIIAGLSAWRLLAIARAWSVTPGLQWGLWVIVILGLTVFWFGALYFILRKISGRKLFLFAAGAIAFGFFGLLMMTPAGFSRINLKLYAKDVWAPDIFTVTWGDLENGLDWYMSFSLPMEEASPANLEIIPTGQDAQAVTTEVWLVGAMWPDGSIIPFTEFQAGAGWAGHQISQGTYDEQPIIVFRHNHPSSLRWEGVTSGPLSLIFAKNKRSGEITLRWNSAEQIIDLSSPSVEFQSITLPTNEELVWQADLPITALTRETTLSIEPDPTGNFPATIQKMIISGVPGQAPQEFTGAKLENALRSMSAGEIIANSEGLKWIPRKGDRPFNLSLTWPSQINLQWAEYIPTLETTLLLVYLSIIGGIILVSLNNIVPTNILINSSLVIVALIVTLLIGELILRIYSPAPNNYFVRPPYFQKVFKPYPGAMPGIEGESHLLVNSQGIRGDELPAGAGYQILAVGGSTTECLLLDQTETWPHQLQEMLNNYNDGPQVWVGNAGKSGKTSREHIMHMKYLLPQYPSLDAVVLLVGINDLQLKLKSRNPHNSRFMASPEAARVLVKSAFSVLVNQDPNLPYYTQSATWHSIQRILQATGTDKQPVADIEIEDEVGKSYLKRRAERKNALVKDTLPSLSAGLDEYKSNLNTIIDISETHNVRLILVTQPAIYRPDLTQEEENLLWFGWGPGREFFYSVDALTEGLAAYNQQLLEVCQERQIECIDLANSTLPKDTTVFYDDVHLNENGANKVAEIIADYMLQQPPFKNLK